MNPLGFGEKLAIGAAADYVVAREPWALYSSAADIDDHIWRAFDRHGDQCQAVRGGGAGTACSLIAGVAVADP